MSRSPMRWLLAASLTFLWGCPPSVDGPPPQPNPAPIPDPPPEATATNTAPEPVPAPTPAADGGNVPDGGACSDARDCASGVCEGEGCGNANGACAAPARACTKDLRTYCGCDGLTFRASGSCPGRRFRSEGECSTAPAGGALDGDACSQAGDCQSGICEGQGCGPKQGKCMAKTRMCTRDLVGYCGCDGKSFRGSGTCPGKRFKSRTLCPGDKPFGP
jgi:hypothetical protein